MRVPRLLAHEVDTVGPRNEADAFGEAGPGDPSVVVQVVDECALASCRVDGPEPSVFVVERHGEDEGLGSGIVPVCAGDRRARGPGPPPDPH